ncbi:MAG: DUF190 domain-containing protein [Parachlamydiaceae bacterium]
MKGIQLKFYVHEHSQHQGFLLYEWLIEKAKGMGVQGGSVFRAIEGFGRDGIVYEERFFELASNVPVEIVFISDEAKSEQLMEFLKKEGLKLFYVKIPVEYGFLN